MKLDEITNRYGEELIFSIIDPIYVDAFGENGPVSVMSNSDEARGAPHKIEITVTFDKFVSSPLVRMMPPEMADSDRGKKIELRAKEEYDKKLKKFVEDLDNAFKKKKKKLGYQGFEDISNGVIFKFGT